jgi:hypothetical protein
VFYLSDLTITAFEISKLDSSDTAHVSAVISLQIERGFLVIRSGSPVNGIPECFMSSRAAVYLSSYHYMIPDLA